jgi:hypothetical protein
MNWFLAKLVFRIVCGNGEHPAQFEEQLRLLSADDNLHAFHKARLIGEQDCNSAREVKKVPVDWKFIDVTELYSLEMDSDGAEIYSLVKEEADSDNYIRTVKRTGTRLLSETFISSGY